MFPLQVEDSLELRVLEDGHADELFAVIDRNRSHLREWLPWVDRSHSVDDVRDHIRNMQGQFASREGLGAVIFRDGAAIGSIGVHRVDFANRCTSIGYWLAADLQGRGVMTKACRAMVGYAFREYNLNRIEIRCATGNTKSCAIPERLGFVREGVLREAQWVSGRFLDLVVWSMLARDWA